MKKALKIDIAVVTLMVVFLGGPLIVGLIFWSDMIANDNKVVDLYRTNLYGKNHPNCTDNNLVYGAYYQFNLRLYDCKKYYDFDKKQLIRDELDKSSIRCVIISTYPYGTNDTTPTYIQFNECYPIIDWPELLIPGKKTNGGFIAVAIFGTIIICALIITYIVCVGNQRRSAEQSTYDIPPETYSSYSSTNYKTDSTTDNFNQPIDQKISVELNRKSNKKLSECTVCLMAVPIDEQIYDLICEHVFHIKCLHKWMIENNKNECPNCRRKIVPFKNLSEMNIV
jgi:hypothetical protein